MIAARRATPAPPLEVARWFNAPRPITLAALLGRVVVTEAFQMLCPGCVSHGLPQAQRIRATFPERDVAVLGLHSVFEHHAAMEPHALEAFLHEYRIAFPVAVDAPGDGDTVPRTMQAWGQRGTPTLWLIDRSGRIRAEHLGQVADLSVGAEIAALVAESGGVHREAVQQEPDDETGPICRPTVSGSRAEGRA